MSDSNISVLVVVDESAAGAAVARALQQAGIDDVRACRTPEETLQALAQRHADILVASWSMQGMTSAAFVQRVRSTNRSGSRHTFVALLADDATPVSQIAFKTDADDIWSAQDLAHDGGTARLLAAKRATEELNGVLTANKVLRKRVRDLQVTDLIDPVTGLGNMRFTLDRISALTRQCESRGGAACVLLTGISNLDAINEQFDQPTVNELVSGMGAKLRHLVRPLDIVTRPDPSTFAVVMPQSSLENCTSSSFRRVFDGLYMQSVKTNSGYIPVTVGVCIAAADAKTGFPEAKRFAEFAYDGLAHSFETGAINVAVYSSAFPARN